MAPALIARELERSRQYFAGTAKLKPPTPPTTRDIVEGFIDRAATEAAIDTSLWAMESPLRASLFVELYLRIDEQAKAVPVVREQQAVPGELSEQFELLAAATAFFADRLHQPRTAYGTMYARSPIAPRARELAEEWAISNPGEQV